MRAVANHLELPPDYHLQFSHSVGLQIRFNDVDRLGHVNNSIYQQFFDLGRLRYFESLLQPPIAWEEVVVVLAHLEVDFISPLHLVDDALVGTRVIELKPRSFLMEQIIFERDSGRVYSLANSVMVGFHTREQRSCDIPSEWLAAMRRFERL